MKNYYEILEVSPKASIEIIEKAYKTLAKKYHPDRNKNENAEEKLLKEKKMKEINEAYAVLSSEFLREQYDKEIQNIKNENTLSASKNTRKKSIENKELNKENQEKNFANTSTGENIVKICKNIFSNKPDFSKLKQMTKNDYISIGLTIAIMIVILLLLWAIPFTRPFIKSIIDIF